MSDDLVLGLHWFSEPGPGQLLWIASGGGERPVVELIDEDPALPGGTYQPAPLWPDDRPQPSGSWMGSLAVPEGADEVRLRVAVGDASRTLLCRRDLPELEPPTKLLALPRAKPRRRTRRASEPAS